MKLLLSLLLLCLSAIAQPYNNCSANKVMTMTSNTVMQVLPVPAVGDRWYICVISISATIPFVDLSTRTLFQAEFGSTNDCSVGTTPMYGFYSYTPNKFINSSVASYNPVETYLPVGQAFCVLIGGVIATGSVQILYASPNTAIPPPGPPPPNPTPGNQINVSGTWVYPDGTAFNGSVIITLVRSTVTLLSRCGSAQVLVFRPITLRIVNGVMPSVNLYPTSCLTPAQPYNVQILDTRGTLLNRVTWSVEGNNGIIDVGQLN
jgi:hypothetical protein